MSHLSTPKVSILLPNYNTRPFLQSRMDSIVNQTYKNWELIIVDCHSNDGAWEFFKSFEGSSYDIQMKQIPREGIYKTINACLASASGEYIYIATSDDTMREDCLEKMVLALEDHQECGLAHCCLTIIDEEGRPSRIVWDNFLPQKFHKETISKMHVRQAPWDGLLYFGLGSIYTSLTQLLIRRDVFKKVGEFKSDWGSIGDVEWCMRVALNYNTLHVPEYLATWRKHDKQATPKKVDTLKNCQLRVSIVQSVFEDCRDNNVDLYKMIKSANLLDFYLYELFTKLLAQNSSIFNKSSIILKYAFSYPRLLIRKIVEKIRFFMGDKNYMGPDDVYRIEGLVQKLGFIASD